MDLEQIRKSKADTSVIFVHGILSDGEKCWQHKEGAYWPYLLRLEKSLKNIGIYVFTYKTGYFSGNYNINDAVTSLWEYIRLEYLADNSKKLVFVCHSMGGIVVRRLLTKYKLEFSEKIKSIGLFLVASPSLGSGYANWLSIVLSAAGHSQGKALKTGQLNTWLNDLDEEFQNLKENRNLPFLIEGKELIEDKGFLLKKQIVEPFSGKRYFGYPYKVPDSNHSSIAKPENKNAIQHRLLCRFIEEFLEIKLNAQIISSQVEEQHPYETIPKERLEGEMADNNELNISGEIKKSVVVSGKGNIINQYFNTSADEKKNSPDRVNSFKPSENPGQVKVFISHIKADYDIAFKLYNDLKNAGADPWIESEDLLAGNNRKISIKQAIKQSKYFIILLSKKSISQHGLFQKELKIGLDIMDEMPSTGIFIIPVRLDDCEPLDERVQDLHRIDLFTSYEKGLQKIVQSVGLSLEKNVSETSLNLNQHSYETSIYIKIFGIIPLFSYKKIRRRLSLNTSGKEFPSFIFVNGKKDGHKIKLLPDTEMMPKRPGSDDIPNKKYESLINEINNANERFFYKIIFKNADNQWSSLVENPMKTKTATIELTEKTPDRFFLLLSQSKKEFPQNEKLLLKTLNNGESSEEQLSCFLIDVEVS